ncbi:MAG TPA: hypothetical protein VLV50_01565 [Stellaceae bacterium]|nr:hypothetical protein [Stellaceae bacterium]
MGSNPQTLLSTVILILLAAQIGVLQPHVAIVVPHVPLDLGMVMLTAECTEIQTEFCIGLAEPSAN